MPYFTLLNAGLMFSSVSTSISNTYLWPTQIWPLFNSCCSLARSSVLREVKFEFDYIALPLRMKTETSYFQLFQNFIRLPSFIYIFWWGWKTLRAKRNDMRRIIQCVWPFWRQIKRMQMNKLNFQRYSVRDKRKWTQPVQREKVGLDFRIFWIMDQFIQSVA